MFLSVERQAGLVWMVGLSFVLIMMMMTRVEETHYHYVALSNIITEKPFRKERFSVNPWLALHYYMVTTKGLERSWTTVGYGRLWLIRKETKYSCRCSPLFSVYGMSVLDDTCISRFTRPAGRHPCAADDPHYTAKEGWAIRPAPGTRRGKGYYVDVSATNGFSSHSVYRLRKGNWLDMDSQQLVFEYPLYNRLSHHLAFITMTCKALPGRTWKCSRSIQVVPLI